MLGCYFNDMLMETAAEQKKKNMKERHFFFFMSGALMWISGPGVVSCA